MSDSEFIEECFPLYNSQICRLCGEENFKGYSLFDPTNSEDLSSQINLYLPIKIIDDGRLPRWICPGCHLQVQATVQFFDLVQAGQKILEQQIRDEFDQEFSDYIEFDPGFEEIETEYDDRIREPLYDCSHELCKRNSHEFRYQSFGAQVGDDDSMKPRKKRGRPRKLQKDIESQAKSWEKLEKTEKPPSPEPQINEKTGRIKRRIKPPTRYNTFEGKELEKLYWKEGVIDRKDYETDPHNNTNGVSHLKSCKLRDDDEELIGHVQTDDGINIGDLIVLSDPQNSQRKQKIYQPAIKVRLVCEICKIYFRFETKFLKHLETHKNVSYECKECLKRFADRQSLTKHQSELQHEGEGIVNRSFEKANSGIQDISNELISKSNVEETIEKQLEDLNNDEGIQSNSSNNNNDSQGSAFSSVDDAENKIQETAEISHSNHIKNATSKQIRKFVCSKCNKTFKHKQILHRHQMVHSNARPYACKICGNTYKCQSHLAGHMVTHTNSRFECGICQQSFVHKTSLRLHERLHTGVKPYKCDECGKRFTQMGNMQEHKRIHTGERPFECPECHMKFKTSSQCRNHVRRHIGDRPLKCHICEDKAFVSPEEYRVHMRRHSKIKPFKCTDCPKSFTDGGALKRHSRVHTGERPYNCGQCTRTFADRSNLKKHFVKVHGEKNGFLRKVIGKTEKLTKIITTPTSVSPVNDLNHEWNSEVHKNDDDFAISDDIDVTFGFCVECNEQFNDRESLLRHQNLHRSKKKLLYLLDESKKDIMSENFSISKNVEHPSVTTARKEVGPLTANLLETTIWSLEDTAPTDEEISGKDLSLPERVLAQQHHSSYACDFCTQSYSHLNGLRHHLALEHSENTTAAGSDTQPLLSLKTTSKKSRLDVAHNFKKFKPIRPKVGCSSSAAQTLNDINMPSLDPDNTIWTNLDPPEIPIENTFPVPSSQHQVAYVSYPDPNGKDETTLYVVNTKLPIDRSLISNLENEIAQPHISSAVSSSTATPQDDYLLDMPQVTNHSVSFINVDDID